MGCNKPRRESISVVRYALKEDIGSSDITSKLVIPAHARVRAVLKAKESFVLCGIDLAGGAFKIIDNSVRFKALFKDGQTVKTGASLARIEGRAVSILTAERVALNFLSLLSAIATKTRKFTQAVKPYKVKITDTRKTIPGLRLLQKYAVRAGGGFNHRFSLDEMIMVKDNHLRVVGAYRNIKKLNRRYKVELEVDNLKQFNEALELNPDIIMLDNMSVNDMKKAVQIRNNRGSSLPKIEASGGITLKNVKKVAACGVDMISIGELTHSIDSVDISLEIL